MPNLQCKQKKLLLLLALRSKMKKRRRRRRFWIREIFKRREDLGEFKLFEEMYKNDAESFWRYCRMTPAQFDEILTLIKPYISKDNLGRKPISPAQRLAVTLRYLATGDSQQTISFSYRLGRSTVNSIIVDTCNALWCHLGPLYLAMPETEEQWVQVARGFYELWNFPNCISAIDGKHVTVQAPSNSGSEFYNYKGTFSIVLLATCDARYCFTMIDVGASGRESDGGVFSHSLFGQLLKSGKLKIPPPALLPGSQSVAPFVVVGDNAFPLRENIMKPYSGSNLSMTQSVFNYRLSRARRVIENTFGVLATRWRIFRRTLIAKPENAVAMVKAACVLHNFLQKKSISAANRNTDMYCPDDLVDSYDENGLRQDGSWRMEGLGNFTSTQVNVNKHGRAAGNVRNTFADYFMSPAGSVPWQNKVVLSTGPNVAQ